MLQVGPNHWVQQRRFRTAAFMHKTWNNMHTNTHILLPLHWNLQPGPTRSVSASDSSDVGSGSSTTEWIGLEPVVTYWTLDRAAEWQTRHVSPLKPPQRSASQGANWLCPMSGITSSGEVDGKTSSLLLFFPSTPSTFHEVGVNNRPFRKSKVFIYLYYHPRTMGENTPIEVPFLSMRLKVDWTLHLWHFGTLTQQLEQLEK